MQISLGTYRLIVNLPAENVGMLLFLLAVTTISYFYMRKLRRERTVKLGNFETLKEVHGKKSIASPSVLFIKFLTVVMLFLVATGSITILSEQPVTQTDFAVAVDNSQSMLTPDYPPNRLEFTKTTLNNWISRLPAKANISVITFAGTAETVQTSTRSPQSIKNAISSIQPDLDSSGTTIGGAIDTAVTQLEGSSDRKKVILVTDGSNTAGKNMTPALSRARENNVSVDIIGISSTESTEALFQNLSETLQESGFEGELERPRINSTRLQNYAESTGGNYYEITSSDFMQNSLKNIVLKEETVRLDSSYYVLIFISLLIISEMLLYSKFGAI